MALLIFLSLPAALPAMAIDAIGTDEWQGVPVGKDRVVYSAQFETQLPESPGVFDAPGSSPCLDSVTPLEVKWVEPADGVTSTTGLLIRMHGIGTGNDCERLFFLIDENWPEEKNVIQANIYYRNLSFRFPYDYGKYQVVDILRGLGHILDLYPQVDRRRLYLYGGSGGGHLALQIIQFVPGLWAEIHVQRPITLITTRDDVLNHGYEEDPSSGWNINLRFPEQQGILDSGLWRRYRAERALRSPQNHARVSAPYSPVVNDDYPHIWLMHGTADATVDFQHFLDYKSAVEQFAGRAADAVTENQWSLGNWNFVQVPGGGHGYPSPPIINNLVPDAMTRRRSTAPEMAIDASLPPQLGYTYRLHGGSPSEIILETIGPVDSMWYLY